MAAEEPTEDSKQEGETIYSRDGGRGVKERSGADADRADWPAFRRTMGVCAIAISSVFPAEFDWTGSDAVFGAVPCLSRSPST